MCGIVGAVAKRDSVAILMEGLKRLEYRGYDSAGIAMLQSGVIERVRVKGKVAGLEPEIAKNNISGGVGIAHTRWATHGAPSQKNAHPHVSGKKIAVVHNGIIENHKSLRAEQEQAGFRFTSDTDTEVIAHQIEGNINEGKDLLLAVQDSILVMEGAYGLGVISTRPEDANRLVVARKGSPLVIGVGIEEYFSNFGSRIIIGYYCRI